MNAEKNPLIILLLCIGAISNIYLIICCFSAIFGEPPKCSYPNCDWEVKSGSDYCSYHSDPENRNRSSYRHSYTSTTSTNTNTGTNRDGSSGNSNYGSSVSKPHDSGRSTSSSSYRPLNNDPEDYDDPEEYADDAWGDDFDDWDEAYDYWEDY